MISNLIAWPIYLLNERTSHRQEIAPIAHKDFIGNLASIALRDFIGNLTPIAHKDFIGNLASIAHRDFIVTLDIAHKIMLLVAHQIGISVVFTHVR